MLKLLCIFVFITLIRLEFLSCLCIVLTSFIALLAFLSQIWLRAEIFRCAVFIMFSFWLNIWYIHFLLGSFFFSMLLHFLSSYRFISHTFVCSYAHFIAIRRDKETASTTTPYHSLRLKFSTFILFSCHFSTTRSLCPSYRIHFP